MVKNHLKSFGLSFLCVLALSLHGQSDRVLKGLNTDYKNGMELYRHGQYGNAQVLLDKVVKQEFSTDHETRASAGYYACLCAIKLYHGDAESRVQRYAEKFELSPLKDRLYLEYANNLFSLKRYKKAAEYYEKVDRYRLTEEQLDEYYFKKAYALLMQGDREAAKPLFFEMKDRVSPYANSSKYYFAHIMYVDSNYAAALTNFLPLQDDESFGPLVPYYLAHIYYQLEDYDKLLEVGEELVETATPARAPEIAKLMGDAFYSKEDYENAIKYLELSSEKGGKMRQQDHFQLGYANYRMKRYAEAINSFNKISEGNRELAQRAYYHLGDCYLKNGDKQSAITAFKAASELTESLTVQEDAFFNYAKLVYEVSDPYTDAITTLNLYLDAFPDSPHRAEIHRYLANLYITTKDYDRALGAIEKSGLESPEMQEAYHKIAFYRASELYNAMKYKAALDKYRESLQYPLNPTIIALDHYWMGETYYKLGEYDKALQSFELFKNSTGAFNMSEYNRANYPVAYCYYKKFDFEKAANHFRIFVNNASKKDKRIADAYLRLADSYLLTSGYLAAAEFYKKALAANTTEADYAMYQRAICSGLAGNNTQKVAQLQELSKKFPNSVYAEEAQYEIAETYLQMENYDKALADFDQFLLDWPNSKLNAKVKLQQGLAYSNGDRNAEAIATYKSIVTQYPGSEESLEAVGLARLVYARQNKIDEYLDWVENIEFVNFDKATLDSTAYNSAFEQYSMGNCEGAVPTLQNYLSRFPKGLFRLKANYYLAECATKLGKDDVALASYKEIMSFSTNEYSVQAVSYLANHAYKQQNYAEALKLYDQWLQISTSKESGTKAQAGVMRSAYALGDNRKALSFATMIVEGESQDMVLQRDARRIIALALIEQQEWEKALENLEWLKANSGGEIKAEASYYYALVKNKQADYAGSSAAVFKLIEDMPDYKMWKLKATILVADNYWKQDDIFQANYTLDFVIKAAYNQEITDEATALKDLIAYEEQRKAELKKMELQLKSDSLNLELGDGMKMIDDGGEPADSTDVYK